MALDLELIIHYRLYEWMHIEIRWANDFDKRYINDSSIYMTPIKCDTHNRIEYVCYSKSVISFNTSLMYRPSCKIQLFLWHCSFIYVLYNIELPGNIILHMVLNKNSSLWLCCHLVYLICFYQIIFFINSTEICYFSEFLKLAIWFLSKDMYLEIVKILYNLSVIGFTNFLRRLRRFLYSILHLFCWLKGYLGYDDNMCGSNHELTCC